MDQKVLSFIQMMKTSPLLAVPFLTHVAQPLLILLCVPLLSHLLLFCIFPPYLLFNLYLHSAYSFTIVLLLSGLYLPPLILSTNYSVQYLLAYHFSTIPYKNKGAWF